MKFQLWEAILLMWVASKNCSYCENKNATRARKKNTLEMNVKSTRKRIDIDFERVSFIYALARLTKIENVWFCSGGFSYAIQEKFTAWRVNFALNFTWKTDIARFAICALSVFRVKFNVEFTRQAVNFSVIYD